MKILLRYGFCHTVVLDKDSKFFGICREAIDLLKINKPIGAAPRVHFFVGGGGGGVWAKKVVMLSGLRISEKKEILRKPTVL
jgi:hypothetical protein